MRLQASGGIHCRLVTVWCAIATASLIQTESVSGQEAPFPSTAETHPGQIVYSRDVPYGSATRRFDQGEAATVNADHSVLIAESLLIGLEPLTDAEQASVSAPLNNAFETSQSALQTGLSALDGTRSFDRDFNRAEGGATGVGGIVSNSLSTLPAALGVIGRVLGDGE